MAAIQTILHPTDFSESSKAAFEAACTVARANQANLIILHVMLPSVSPVQESPPPDPRQPAESSASSSAFPWPRPSDVGLSVAYRLAEGDPASEILLFAEAFHCDLIVMGSHGRTGLSRLVTGSVAEEVLRTAACPVLVVKTPAGARIAGEAETAASPGDVIDVRPLGASLASAQMRQADSHLGPRTRPHDRPRGPGDARAHEPRRDHRALHRGAGGRHGAGEVAGARGRRAPRPARRRASCDPGD